MTAADLDHALSAGRHAVIRAAAHRPDLLVLREMGIGNTTAANGVRAKTVVINAAIQLRRDQSFGFALREPCTSTG